MSVALQRAMMGSKEVQLLELPLSKRTLVRVWVDVGGRRKMERGERERMGEGTE